LALLRRSRNRNGRLISLESLRKEVIQNNADTF